MVSCYFFLKCTGELYCSFSSLDFFEEKMCFRQFILQIIYLGKGILFFLPKSEDPWKLYKCYLGIASYTGVSRTSLYKCLIPLKITIYICGYFTNLHVISWMCQLNSKEKGKAEQRTDHKHIGDNMRTSLCHQFFHSTEKGFLIHQDMLSRWLTDFRFRTMMSSLSFFIKLLNRAELPLHELSWYEIFTGILETSFLLCSAVSSGSDVFCWRTLFIVLYIHRVPVKQYLGCFLKLQARWLFQQETPTPLCKKVVYVPSFTCF